MAGIEREVKALKAKLPGAVGQDRDRLAMKIEALEESIPPNPPVIPAIRNDPAHRTPMHVLKRGVWENKGEAVGPRPPSILVADDLPELPPDVADPRTRLARWLAAPGHPLTARVIVNRVWEYHLGAGIVRTANDFGTHGDRPSHPELLDWLSATLVDGGWRLKPVHRLILLSASYRQSSHPDADAAKVPALEDPDDRLLWRFRRRRLDAEEVRDAMLAASGRLNPKAAGPSVVVPVDPAIVSALYKPSQWQVTRDPAEHDRRSIYLMAKRNLRLPMFEVFDAPALASSCPRARAASTPRRRSSCSTAGWPMTWRRRSPTACGTRPPAREPDDSPRLPPGAGPIADRAGGGPGDRVPARWAARRVRPGPVQPQRVPLCTLRCLARSRIPGRPAPDASSSATAAVASAGWRWPR